MSHIQYFQPGEDFVLENGQSINKLRIAYHTFGQLNETNSNVVWVFHALTADSNPTVWWKGLVGENDLIHPADYFIICVNTLGSPYGSTQPDNLDFPVFTVRDVVNTQLLLAEYLGIDRIFLAIGGSFGGSQAMEFAYSFQGQIDHLVLLVCAAKETAWGIAIHQAQRLALQADCTFGEINGGAKGLKAARAIGLLTYRTHDAFIQTQTDDEDLIDDFKAQSYINYQGEKLVARFNALSYYYLNKCLDTPNMGRGRGGVKKALKKITCPSLVIGIDTDQLLPCYLQKELAQQLYHATYAEIKSDYGHDGFLIETQQISELIQKFISPKK